jgi:hypothetical protein
VKGANVYEVKAAYFGSTKLDELLDLRYEPFAANGDVIYLRRIVWRQRAGS